MSFHSEFSSDEKSEDREAKIEFRLARRPRGTASDAMRARYTASSSECYSGVPPTAAMCRSNPPMACASSRSASFCRVPPNTLPLNPRNSTRFARCDSISGSCSLLGMKFVQVRHFKRESHGW